MLRRDVSDGVKQVLDAVRASELSAALRRGSGKESPQNVLRALRNYSLAANAFGPSARAIVKAFELERLEDVDVWIKLLGDGDEVLLLRNRLTYMGRELPTILALLSQETVDTESSVADSELGGLQIQLIEEKGTFSTVSRVIQALAACQELYDSLAALEGDITQPLAIGAIDSGSDKAFDLFGAAKVMTELRKLVLSIWDLVVFHRERKLGKQLELIAAALPILEKVNRLESQEKLGREQAQIIRNGIIDGTKMFLDAGVTIEELKQHSTASPRALLAPEPKLLSAPAPTAQSSATTQVPTPDPGTELSPAPRRNSRVPHGLSDDDIRRIAEAIRQSDQGPLSTEDDKPT